MSRALMLILLFVAQIPFSIVEGKGIRMREILVEPEDSLGISREFPSLGEISSDLADRLPLIDNDVYRAAQIFPGVTANDFSARFHVRGGELNEIGVKLDSIPLYQPYHLQDFGGAISTIDLGLIQRARLFMGGYPPRYGDWISAVYDIYTRSQIPPKTQLEAGIDLINTDLMIDSPLPRLKNGHWLLSLRRGYIDLIMKMIQSEEKFEPRYFDLFNKISFAPSPDSALSINLLYAKDTNLIDEIGRENDVDSSYENGMIWSSWDKRLGGRMNISSSLFAGKYNGRKREGLDGVDDRNLGFVGAKADMSLNLRRNIARAGIELQHGCGRYDYHHSEEGISTDVKGDLAGWFLRGYLQDTIGLGDARLGGGFGWWYQSNGGRFSISPRLSLSLPIGEKLRIKGAWGLFRQPVRVTELPVEEGISEVTDPQRAAHYIIGLEYRPNDKFLLKAEAYRKEMRDLVGRIEDYGRKERFFIRARSGYAHGLEVFLNQILSDRLSWMLGYTYSVAKAHSDAGEFFRPFDQRHTLGIDLNYRTGYGVLNLSWRFHTGNPYTDSWYEKVNGEWVKRYGDPYAERLPSYHSLDLRFSREFKFRRWQLNLYLQVMNLYNRQNVHEYSWSKIEGPNGQVRYERVEEHYLPILPTFGIRVKF